MIKLTEYSKNGGCAAKIGPGDLASVLRQLPKVSDPRLLVGIATSDDAGVYKLNETTALIQTVDFFTPIVDDPYTFGQIAAANSLSDVYAMGGKPLTAMNIVAFPVCKLDPKVLLTILQGGQDKVSEAGALIVGGHSIHDDEPKYGLSVTGVAHPDKILTNAGAKAGDVLLITKAIGTGVLTMAARAEMFADGVAAAIKSMVRLNRVAAEIMTRFTIHACTDVTGFGLLGHLHEMADASRTAMEIDTKALPLLPEAKKAAEMGLVPASAYNTRAFLKTVTFAHSVPECIRDLCFDPQTSGGLLMSVPEEIAAALLIELREAGIAEAAIIGCVTNKKRGEIYVY
ncbi:selenide, water dikinase SelD [Pelosinus sp. UFO1]|uniref:selenide, water dikinase SelD n=1 Tax=Pelosinus sp. UFO1 TaxID=484770 RepID=UPI0004D0DBB3|nr:selenide, water dikinase SelD [Pelosinus sp. UFO1]AIF51404.1 Selenide, water dikinase [Pelosinus sp. UFO1]